MTPQTLIEKLLSRLVGRRAHAGEVVVAPVDRVLLQDATAWRVFERLEALGFESCRLSARTTLYFDHGVAPSTPEIAVRQAELRARAREFSIEVSVPGRGISHQVLAEEKARPGELIVGADSHTCTAGALGAVGLGMGSTDIAVAIALGETWLSVPTSISVELEGVMPRRVSAKDLMLQLIGRVGASGADYACLEFTGPGLPALPMDDRFVLANLAAEVGAKTGIIGVDEVTRAFLRGRGRDDGFEIVGSDAGANYDRHLKIDLAGLEPMIARPGRHDDTTMVRSLDEVRVDQVVIGSCTNGRVSDFEAAAQILTGRRVHPDLRLLLAPASSEILGALAAQGTLERLVEAGGILLPPGCGPCVGIHEGVLGAGQVCVATQSRNFPGRMGDPGAAVYLASPFTAAATAVRGVITDPREFVDGA